MENFPKENSILQFNPRKYANYYTPVRQIKIPNSKS